MKAIMIALIGFLFVSNSFAGHREDRLRVSSSARLLDRTVSYSHISYRVKRAVSRFTRVAADLEYCKVDRFGEPGIKGHGDDCHDVERSTRRLWSDVDYYLYDTQWDFPQIYSAYRNTQRALWSL